MSDKINIAVPRIEAGTKVEYKHGDDNTRMTAKINEAGQYVIKERGWLGRWHEETYTPEKFHAQFRKVTESPAMAFIRSFIRNNREKRRQKLSGLKSDLFRLAISAQMQFNPGDFGLDELQGVTHWRDEPMYRFIVDSGNKSAIVEMERIMKRDPWLWQDAYFAGLEKPRRLYVGASFDWEGLRVNVTSFQGSGPETMIACHQEHIQETRQTKTRRIFKITHQDVAARLERMTKLLALNARYYELATPKNRDFPQYNGSDPAKELLCDSCYAEKRGESYIDRKPVYDIDAIVARCSCGVHFHTRPTTDTLIHALDELEQEPVIDGDDLRAYVACLPLGVQAEYGERLLALAARVRNEVAE